MVMNFITPTKTMNYPSVSWLELKALADISMLFTNLNSNKFNGFIKSALRHVYANLILSDYENTHLCSIDLTIKASLEVNNRKILLKIDEK